MRLIDADALLKHECEATQLGNLLAVGKGYILDAPTVEPVNLDFEPTKSIKTALDWAKQTPDSHVYVSYDAESGWNISCFVQKENRCTQNETETPPSCTCCKKFLDCLCRATLLGQSFDPDKPELCRCAGKDFERENKK